MVSRLSVLNVIGRTSPSWGWLGLERLGGQCGGYLLRGLLPRGRGPPPLPPGGPEPVPPALIAEPVSERGGKRPRVVGRDQLTRAAAVGGGAERFRQPADGGRDDG